jgi:predicted GH43/DUF377 family glycosyl hydrolase
MLSIRKAINYRYADVPKAPQSTIQFKKEIPPFELNDIIPNINKVDYSCDYSRLKYINNEDLIDSYRKKGSMSPNSPDDMLYNYNACIHEIDDNLYRMFYRCSSYSKAWRDRIATCLLAEDMQVIADSNKYINGYSNWDESTDSNEYFQSMILYKYKDGEHLEDPRAVLWNNNWYVFYTDGIKMGVAKLDYDCNTIYSHYLSLPNVKTSIDHDGREKNWIPFVSNGNMYIFYSSSPYTLLRCREFGNSLIIASSILQDYNLKWEYGDVRGGAPPCVYDSNHLIWFFHSANVFKSRPFERIYTMGAYLTTNIYPFRPVKITRIPLLAGIPGPINEYLKYSNNVIFPCGAVKTNAGWKVSMGVHDANIGLLDVCESDFIWDRLYFPIDMKLRVRHY